MQANGNKVILHSFPCLGQEEVDAVSACVQSNQLTGASRVAALEQTIVAEMNYHGALATTSGTQAMFLALKATYDKKARIGLPSYVCRSLYDAIWLAGCEPVILDIDYDNLAISHRQAKESRLDGIIVAHMFGINAGIDRFLDLEIPIIEDCAQRIPAFERFSVETASIMRVLSMEGTKLFTCGEGGVLLCNDAHIYTKAHKLRTGEYDLKEAATKVPLTDLQASIALVQWKKLPGFLKRRVEIAKYYIDTLTKAGLASVIHPAMFKGDTFHYRFVVEVNNPDKFIAEAEKRNIKFRKPIAPLPLHQLFNDKKSFDTTEQCFNKLLSIPLYPALHEEDLPLVINTFIEIQNNN